MSATVPWKRAEVQDADVRVGEPVRAQTWRELADIYHWLRGHGMRLIPAHYPGIYLNSSTPESVYYRIQPQGFAIARVWVILAHQDQTLPAAEVRVTLSGGGQTDFIPPQGPGASASAHRRAVVLTETLAAKSAAQEDVTVTFSRISGAAAVTIDGIACWELPRAVLSLDANDGGVDLETIRPGALLIQAANRSIHAVVSGLQDAMTRPRRMCYEWSGPTLISDPGGATNPTPWVDLLSMPVHVLLRRQRVGTKSGTLTWDVRAALDTVGDKFEIRVTTGNAGNTATLTATSTTEGWLGPSTITADAEDVDAADGIPATGHESVQFAVRRITGSGRLLVRSLAAWEAT